MPELVTLHEIERFLPLPYEAAAEPRLRRAQERLQGAEWVRLPEEGALTHLHALAGSIRSQGRTLVMVEDGGLGPGVRGAAECLGLPEGPVRFLSGLPSPEALRRALELAERGDMLLCAAAGGEETPAFRLFREALERRHGAEAGRYLLESGGERGGFALLSPPGLLSLAVSGVDVEALLTGAADMRRRCRGASFENPAWRYAAARRQLCRSGFTLELLCAWDGALVPLLEWAGGILSVQGLLAAAADHSRGSGAVDRCAREGGRGFFETVVRLEEEEPPLGRLRQRAAEAALRAHTARGVPNLILRPGGRTAEALGGLIYFFQYAAGLSSCLMDPAPPACLEPPERAAEGRDWFREVPPEPAAGSRRPVGAGIL